MTTEELLKYAWLHKHELTQEWIDELLRRLEALLDDGR